MKRLIQAEARRELLAGVDYYTQISPELGARFYLEMERPIAEVCRYPQTFRQFDPPARRHLCTCAVNRVTGESESGRSGFKKVFKGTG